MASVISVDAIEITLELRSSLTGSMIILYDSGCVSFMLAREIRSIEAMRLVRNLALRAETEGVGLACLAKSCKMALIKTTR